MSDDSLTDNVGYYTLNEYCKVIHFASSALLCGRTEAEITFNLKALNTVLVEAIRYYVDSVILRDAVSKFSGELEILITFV